MDSKKLIIIIAIMAICAIVIGTVFSRVKSKNEVLTFEESYEQLTEEEKVQLKEELTTTPDDVVIQDINLPTSVEKAMFPPVLNEKVDKFMSE